MTDYTIYIYSIRTFNNNNLIFYNYTKQKRINDVLSSYKSRYKRYLNKCDNFMNIFYILQADKSYIKIEEKFTTDNEDNVKSKLYDYIANNNCINKLDTDQIEQLCNKTEEPITENEIQNKTEPKTEIIEEVIIEPKTDIIDEPKLEEPKTEPITETKIVKYIKEYTADISNIQVELLNDNLVEEPTNDVKVVKNLADVKSIDSVYEPSITSSSRYSTPSFKQQFKQQLQEQILNHHNKTIRILNNKNTTLKKNKKDI
jgi:hypothetical protein